jgi:aspartate racemase
MKTIGLVGGMSWESTVTYYKIINEEVKARMGGFHSARCVLYSVDFDEIEEYQREDKWDKAAQVLIKAVHNLEMAGADFVVICANTMHKVTPEIEKSINVPLLHIADLTAKKVLLSGIKTVGLLGTRYTMEQDFYKSRLECSGLNVVVPNEHDRDIVNRVIYNELCLGIINQQSKDEFKRIIEGLADSGVQGVILGCTEIGLLIRQEDFSLPLYDTAVIHAKGVAEYALK